MMSELRIGSLALIVKAYTDQSSVGKVVEIHSTTDKSGSFISPATGKVRFCPDAIFEKVYVCIGDFHSGSAEAEETGFGLFRRVQLMPIDGEDFSHEDERQKELTNG
ncbi:hypothetical protein KKZ39_17200 [Enterobacter hormaechei subsp. xiangfangensis]|uniref:hypothetical protein n=1 Tax=Enterobacter hormaechei TaxID=158836 RepID=UPI001BE083B9|nr:hypothetical protein [Enterobacter hormaechei subsp. xiangfangensis]